MAHRSSLVACVYQRLSADYRVLRADDAPLGRHLCTPSGKIDQWSGGHDHEAQKYRQIEAERREIRPAPAGSRICEVRSA